MNFRNHRKIVVVDEAQAWVGGHNVGDEYLGGSKRFGPWRDTHMRVDGPAALTAQLSFVEDWYWATGTLPEPWQAPAVTGDELCTVVPTGPADVLDTGNLFAVSSIHAAQRQLWIATPYLVPDQAVISALQLAALRGVDVRILFPLNPDKKLPWLAAHTYLDELYAAGVKVYAYREGSCAKGHLDR